MKKVALLMLVLTGCGQKGDLYLPDDSSHSLPSGAIVQDAAQNGAVAITPK